MNESLYELVHNFFKANFPYVGEFEGGEDSFILMSLLIDHVSEALSHFDPVRELTESRFGKPDDPRNPRANKARIDLIAKQKDKEATIIRAKLNLIHRTMKNWAYGWDKAGIPINYERIAKHTSSHHDIINKRLPAKNLYLICASKEDLLQDLRWVTIKGLRDFDHKAAFTSNFKQAKREAIFKARRENLNLNDLLAEIEKKRIKREEEKKAMDPAALLDKAERMWIYTKCTWHIRRLQYNLHPNQSGCVSKLSLDQMLQSRSLLVDSFKEGAYDEEKSQLHIQEEG